MSFKDFKDIVEIAYYFSCIGLFIVALFGLKQLTIAKSDIRIRSLRESANIATEQCKMYIRDIIPLIDRLDTLLDEYEVPDFKGPINQFMQEELGANAKWYKEWDQKMEKMELSKNPNYKFNLDTINALESFSIYFTRGIADETIAFSSVGITYCKSVERFYPFISLMRTTDSRFNYYENIVQLYKLWKSRIDRLGLLEQKEKIEKKLKETPNTHIKPEGTK